MSYCDLENSCKLLNTTIAVTENVIKQLYAEKCELNKRLENIRKIAYKNLQDNQCSRCDGIGLDDCADENCSYYQMNEIIKIIERDD